MRRAAASVMILLLAACGQKADLKPRTGQAMPVAPYGRGDKPTPDQLLKITPQAAPERSVELRKRSEERAQDPFDLPPSDDE